MKQTTMFGQFDQQRLTPNVRPQDQARLRGHNLAILERLTQGPATNHELSQISLKYTSRISDLRKAGYTILCSRLHGGLTQYELEEPV